MKVAFVNENTLGHASYLLPFVRTIQEHPEWDVQPEVINATPLPRELERRANFSIRGLRKLGLDFFAARWRLTVSRHVRDQLIQLRTRQPIDAVVVNTQSVALKLPGLARDLPVLVCLDATFKQLARTRWFAGNPGARLFLPLTLAPLRAPERELLELAARLLPWSEPVKESLLNDYRLPPAKVSLLPPSVALPPLRTPRPPHLRPQILFVGGDFQRKGGPLLLECYRQYFSRRCDLHLMTESKVFPEPGVFVHRGLQAHSDAWRERWENADVFVFPSRLETFGIVLLEALAFQVPVISADVGAARYVLADGKAGWLLSRLSKETLAFAIQQVLSLPDHVLAHVEAGRKRVATEFDLKANSQRLAEWLIAGDRR